MCIAFLPIEIEVMMIPLDFPSRARPFPVARRQAPRSAGGSGANRVVAERLRSRKRRIRVIRTRVVAIATATFLASSGGILVQLVTGNDPALAKAAKVASAAGKSSSSGSTSSSAKSSSSISGTSSGSSSSGTTAVTTSSS